MAMYLAGVLVSMIMLLGRWSSDAFMHYIRKQVKKFSIVIGSRMIQHENFFTIPSASLEDPRMSNHPLKLSLGSNVGFSSTDTIRPLVSVFQ
jgi:hypothetical protein